MLITGTASLLVVTKLARATLQTQAILVYSHVYLNSILPSTLKLFSELVN